MRADDPHLIERLARLAAFHDLPGPVVVEMTMLASELQRRPVSDVYAEIRNRIAEIRRRDEGDRKPRPRLRVIQGGEA
jgi:hypothetical protein